MAGEIVTGWHPHRGSLFAAIDPKAHHVEGRLAERRFSAFLSPFRCEGEALSALAKAGCSPANIEASQGRAK